jgi:hypothetical protein
MCVPSPQKECQKTLNTGLAEKRQTNTNLPNICFESKIDTDSSDDDDECDDDDDENDNDDYNDYDIDNDDNDDVIPSTNETINGYQKTSLSNENKNSTMWAGTEDGW